METVPPIQQAHPEPCYTAGQLAIGSGRSKRGVLYALAGIAPDTAAVVRGKAVDAWRFGSLPLRLQERLDELAEQRGFRTAGGMLAAGEKPWAPRVPIREVRQDYIDKAVKLQRALANALQSAGNLSKGEFLAMGLRDFKAAFDYTISAHRWKQLLKRTLERDRGAENWERLEIYLDDRAPAREATSPRAEAGIANPDLQNVIRSFNDSAKPSVDEVAYLWSQAFEQYEVRINAGAKAKKCKRLLLEFLFVSVPSLAATRAGLRCQFERKFKTWVAGGRAPGAVTDQRHEKSGRFRKPEISGDDLDRIVSGAVLVNGGRLAPAWRDLRESGGIGEAISGHYLSNPSRRSYVPKAVREAATPIIDAMEDIHHGPRQAKLNGAYISRDWNSIAAGDWYQADDCTLPVYYYEPDGADWFTLWRGQWLPMIDCRSTRILGHVLISARSYNSLAIRTLVTRVCDDHGLPRQGFYFERGIWESSRLLKGKCRGKSGTAFSGPEIEKGLMDLGLKFQHANLPRAKPIERVLGAMQDLMEGEPGYAGRDERKDRYERLEKDKLLVESKNLDPREKFYSPEQWLDRLDGFCERYNATPQDGKMTGGLSPDEAFAKFRNPEDLQIKFDASCRFLLAHQRWPTKVTRNGITLRIGKNAFNYRSAETGQLIGQTVLAWFNPELPDLICVTDLERKNAFSVERSQDVPAIDAPREMFAKEMQRIAAHHSHFRSYYRTLKSKFMPKFRRAIATDAENIELGQEISRQREQFSAARKQESRTRLAQDGAAQELARTMLRVESEAGGGRDTEEALL